MSNDETSHRHFYEFDSTVLLKENYSLVLATSTRCCEGVKRANVGWVMVKRTNVGRVMVKRANEGSKEPTGERIKRANVRRGCEMQPTEWEGVTRANMSH